MQDHPLFRLVEPLHPDITEKGVDHPRHAAEEVRPAGIDPFHPEVLAQVGDDRRDQDQSRPDGAFRGGPRSWCPDELSHQMLKKRCRMLTCMKYRRHQPPDLAVQDVGQGRCHASVLPGRGTLVEKQSVDSISVKLAGDSCRKKTTTQMPDQDHRQGAAAQARIGPQVGDFAIVFPELAGRALARDGGSPRRRRPPFESGGRRAGSDSPRSSSPARAEVVFIINPEQPALGPLVDAGLDPERQQVVGEDLGVDTLGQCSDLAQRSIPSNAITPTRRTGVDPAPSTLAATLETTPDYHKRGAAHTIGLPVSAGSSFVPKSAIGWATGMIR